MRKRKTMSVILACVLVSAGCNGKENEGVSEQPNEESVQSAEVNTVTDISDMFSGRDYEVGYDSEESAIITLNGDSAVCSSDAVKIDGSTITITDEGTYIFTGTLDDGRIIVNAEETDKPQLVFDGVSVNCETSAPLYILEADKVFVTLASDTDNTLSNGGTFTTIDDNNIDAAIFSKQDLTFNGSGNLTVTSPAGHGIVSKDDLVFTSGTYIIDSASHGLEANDSVRIVNAELTITAGKDGVHAENSDDTSLGFVYIGSGTLDISAEGDGISAGSYMQIDDGTFTITTGGGSENAVQKSSASWGEFRGGMSGRGGMKPGEGEMKTDQGDMKPGRGDRMTEQSNMEFEQENMKPSQEGTVPQPEDVETVDSQTDGEDSSTSIKGLKATGDLIIQGGNITIDSADDSIHSNSSIMINGGSFEITAGDDAFHADENLTVNSGTIYVAESYEALEGLHVSITGGDITVTASDDGINAAGGTDSSGFGGQRGNEQFGGKSSSGGSIVISGGNIHVTASGDGIDANGSLKITGGTTIVTGPTQGDTATLDYDTEGIITGGTFIGTGAAGMAQSFSDSEQGVIAINVGAADAGESITVLDANGTELLSHTPELSYNVFIFSSEELVKGETYTVTFASSSVEVTAN